MSKHTQHYFELNPAPREPGPVRIVLGALCALVGLWFIIIVLFSL